MKRKVHHGYFAMLFPPAYTRQGIFARHGFAEIYHRRGSSGKSRPGTGIKIIRYGYISKAPEVDMPVNASGNHDASFGVYRFFGGEIRAAGIPGENIRDFSLSVNDDSPVNDSILKNDFTVCNCPYHTDKLLNSAF
jgi:hypothetical protein